jgi:hypothetical protein
LNWTAATMKSLCVLPARCVLVKYTKSLLHTVVLPGKVCGSIHTVPSEVLVTEVPDAIVHVGFGGCSIHASHGRSACLHKHKVAYTQKISACGNPRPTEAGGSMQQTLHQPPTYARSTQSLFSARKHTGHNRSEQGSLPHSNHPGISNTEDAQAICSGFLMQATP